MKAINIWMLGTALFAGLASCEMKDEIFGKDVPAETGYLTLDVNAGSSASVDTKAAATDDKEAFPLVITAKDFELAKNYDSFAKFKEENKDGVIELPIGNYEIAAHSPGEFADKMSSPYYSGTEKVEITAGLEKATTVKCTIQSVKIMMNFSDNFKLHYSDWNITVDSKKGVSSDYSDENPDPAPVFWKMPAETDKIYVSGTATVKETGETVAFEQVLAKKESTDYEEGDSPYYVGGDGVLVTFDPITEADLNKSNIKITVQGFNQETNEKIDIDVEIGGDGGGENPDQPDPPVTGDGPSITLPQDAYTLPGDAAKDATAVIASASGLKSVKVKIVSGNQSFADALDLLPVAFPDDPDKQAKVDLQKGVELVGNTLLPTVISSALPGANVPIPSAGDKEYSFPVHSFFNALKDLDSTGASAHQFEITVVDNNDKTVSKTLSVTVK